MVCMMRFGDFPPCKKYGRGAKVPPPQSLTPTKCFNISDIDPYVHKEKLGMSPNSPHSDMFLVTFLNSSEVSGSY